MPHGLHRVSLPGDTLRELDDLAAARGILLGSLYGGMLWALIGLALAGFHLPG
jgi:hypothetical protein